MMSISVRNWTVASSRWLVWAVALCSFSPTVMWMWGVIVWVFSSQAMVPPPSASTLVRVDVGPDGGVGVVEPLAGADNSCGAEAGDEDGDVALLDAVSSAGVGEGGEEVVAVVEDDADRATRGEFVATHSWCSAPHGRCCRV